MNDRELYQQEKQAILDDYEEKLKELKEMASASNTNAKTKDDTFRSLYAHLAMS